MPKDAVFPMPQAPSLGSRFNALSFSNMATFLVGLCEVQLVTKAPVQPPILL